VVTILKEIYQLPLPPDTYLAGGTAVALYLGHRISIDIDLFTEKEFYSGPIILSLKERHVIEVVSATEKDTFVANINKVRLSLFRYPYSLLEPTNYNPDLKIHIASPLDIAVMKVVAIVQRGTAKDFVDLRAIISVYELSLQFLISQIHKKYGVSEEYSYQINKSLVFFDDAVKGLGDVTLVKNGKVARIEKREWDEVEDFFKRLVMKK
jgi:hypothetical protein